jgi:uncharacterized membrane protein
MATLVAQAKQGQLKADTFEKVLASSAATIWIVLMVALFRGFQGWDRVPAPIWVHIATILVALTLTPVMLLRRRGDRVHRILGWVWAVALIITAADTFLIQTLNPGSLSYIHLLSAWTLLQVPLLVFAARTHNVRRHRSAVRGMTTGALLIAGVFTLLPGRLLPHWLFG